MWLISDAVDIGIHEDGSIHISHMVNVYQASKPSRLSWRCSDGLGEEDRRWNAKSHLSLVAPNESN